MKAVTINGPLELLHGQEECDAATAIGRKGGLAVDRATLNQAGKVLEVFGDISAEHLQRIIASGFLADLRDSTQFPDRDELRGLFGLPPLEKLQVKERWPGRTWMTLGIVPVSRDTLHIALLQAGFEMSLATRRLILRGGPFSSNMGDKPYEVPLVQLRVRDLGFQKDPTTQELFVRARQNSLDLCPDETGPYLALALREKLEGLFWVASKVYDSDRIPYSFCLERKLDGGLRLAASRSLDGDTWPLPRKVILCRK